jgi:hypothetical protein
MSHLSLFRRLYDDEGEGERDRFLMILFMVDDIFYKGTKQLLLLYIRI